ncbi:MAG: hypothetical protein PVF15_06355 [Candidatus Bathyarchaeota archaeon]|jgi:hypothetical protein
MRKEINQKIIDVLKADGALAGEVKDWIYGLPKKTPAGYPIIFLKAGEERKQLVNPQQYLYSLDFMIGITHMHVNEDTAEKKVQNLADQAETAAAISATIRYSFLVTLILSPLKACFSGLFKCCGESAG